MSAQQAIVLVTRASHSSVEDIIETTDLLQRRDARNGKDDSGIVAVMTCSARISRLFSRDVPVRGI
jgi:hypothetical protein